MIEKLNKKIKWGAIIAISITAFGIIADIEGFTSTTNKMVNWAKEDPQNIITILLILLLMSSILLNYNIYKKNILLKKSNDLLQGINLDLDALEKRHKDIIRHFIRFLRSVSLDAVTTPIKYSQLNLFMTKLRDSLPENGNSFRLALAIPLSNGKFSIIHSIGIEEIKINQLQKDANWRRRKSFFAYAMYFVDKNYKVVYNEDDMSYLSKKPKNDYEATKSHLVIALKDDIYKQEKNICNGCLAVLTISTTHKNLLPKEKEDHYYDRIYPSIKGIEGVLLQYNIIEKNKLN